MEFPKHPYLEKYLSDFEEEHPLLSLFSLNPDYMNHIEKLFEDIDSVPNLSTRVGQMKDPSNWESALSEIEFAKEIKDMKPEFLVSTSKAPCPDLKARLFGKEIFFEVKLLLENDETSRVSDEIWRTKSDLIVNIGYNKSLNREQADNLIEILKDKIKSNQIGLFAYEETDFEILKKTTQKTQRTSLVARAGPFTIPFEPLRRAVFINFFAKLYQFMTCKPMFWVVDCKRWKYDKDTFHQIVYGTITVDIGVGYYLYGLYGLTKKYYDSPEYFEGSNLVPQLRYPQKDGLYFLTEASCLNGIIARTHGNSYLLPNPFAEAQIDSDSFRQLKKAFTVEI
jgi:hypothetical protein